MNKLIVDRICEGIAFCEDENGKIKELEKNKFKGKIKEGDIVILGANKKYETDKKATEIRREQIYSLQNSLFK